MSSRIYTVEGKTVQIDETMMVLSTQAHANTTVKKKYDLRDRARTHLGYLRTPLTSSLTTSRIAC